MRVGLFEQRRELGILEQPVNQDFKLREKGLDFICYEVMASMAFAYEKCLVFYTAVEWDKEAGAITPKLDTIGRNINELPRICTGLNSGD